MKYDESICKFNMDTGCVELLLRDGRMISINCTGVEDTLDVTTVSYTHLDVYKRQPLHRAGRGSIRRDINESGKQCKDPI